MPTFLMKLLRRVAIRVLKKTSLALVFDKLEEAAVEMANEKIVPKVLAIKVMGRELKDSVSKAPKVPDFTKPEVKATLSSKPKIDLASLLLDKEPSQTEQTSAMQDLDSEHTIDDSDVDVYLIADALMKGIPSGTASSVMSSFNLANLRTDNLMQATIDKINAGKNMVLNKIKPPANNESSVGQITGESLKVFRRDGMGKNVSTAKMVRFRNSKGFRYENENLQSARYDNPLKIHDDYIDGKTSWYKDAMSSENLAVYDDPYYSFEAATRQLAGHTSGSGNLSVENVLYLLNFKGNKDYDAKKKAPVFCSMMNRIVGANVYNGKTIIAKRQLNRGYFPNVEDFVAFFKAYAMYQSQLNVSTIYLTRVYNAIYKGGIPPLQNENADWGDMDYWKQDSNGNYIFVNEYSEYKQDIDKGLVSLNGQW